MRRARCPVAAPPLPLANSTPADAPEEAGDLSCGAIGIFAMREVTDIGKQREIEIRERLAESVGPFGKQDRIAFSPADARLHGNLRQRRHLTLHHCDAARMRATVMRKAAGEIAGLQKIVDETIEHIIECVFAMRPMAQKIFDIQPARLATPADKRGRELHLMEGLVPDFVEAIRRAHARADAGINEIEEEQAGETLG